MTTIYHQQDLFAPTAAVSSSRAECDDGEARKQKRLTAFQERRADYVRQGQRALLTCLLDKTTATADDVRPAVELPPSIDPRCLGAVPGVLAKAGIIRSLGYVKSNRPERHASPIQLWALADRAAAIEWLAANPDVASDDEPPPANEKNPTVPAAFAPSESTDGEDDQAGESETPAAVADDDESDAGEPSDGKGKPQ